MRAAADRQGSLQQQSRSVRGAARYVQRRGHGPVLTARTAWRDRAASLSRDRHGKRPRQLDRVPLAGLLGEAQRAREGLEAGFNLTPFLLREDSAIRCARVSLVRTAS